MNLTDADRAAWRLYERESALAAEQFNALPISARTWPPTIACRGCGGRTYEAVGPCWACRREGVRL